MRIPNELHSTIPLVRHSLVDTPKTASAPRPSKDPSQPELCHVLIKPAGFAPLHPANLVGHMPGAGPVIQSSITQAADGQTSASLMHATRHMQETQMSFNLQYLQLQNSMQNDNRQYTAVSNIMKTKHDTVKNSISNIR